MKIAVLMSGGVDSSVTAGILARAGHEVIGLTMINWEEEVAQRAAVIAGQLRIPFRAVDMRSQFYSKVVDPFCSEYALCRTPNPCIVCNEFIKFGCLLDLALEMGCDAVATGHYARIWYNHEWGNYEIRRGLDIKKDQSYFLYRLDQQQLSRILFPLGELQKNDVRRMAAELGIECMVPSGESQEICFINDHYTEVLKSTAIMPAGPIVDENGIEVGLHRGLHNYTIGQRKGLGIAAGRPLYVLELDRANNRLIVGDEKSLYSPALLGAGAVWSRPRQGIPERIEVKIRYAARPSWARLDRIGRNSVRVAFEEPQRAITPGQSVVFYDGDSVIGGAVIDQALKC